MTAAIVAFLNLFQTLDVFVTRYYRQHSYPIVNVNLQLGISVLDLHELCQYVKDR